MQVAATAAWLILSAVQPPTPEAPIQDPPAAAAQADTGLAQLSMDELIARLPPAGEEWRWNRAEGGGHEDPAAVEMERRMATQRLTEEQWRTALLSTGALRFREAWPRDEEYAISMTVPRWLGVTQIRLAPRLAGLAEIQAGELMMGFSGTLPAMRARDARRGQILGKLPEGTTELRFEVTVERGISALSALWSDKPDPPAGVLWQGTITTPIRLVGSHDEAVPAANTPELDAAVRDAIGGGFRDWHVEGRRQEVAYLVVDPDTAKHPELARTALNLKVEILRDGAVAEETTLIAQDADTLSLTSSLSTGRKRFYGSRNLKVLPPNEEGHAGDAGQWSVSITGQAQDSIYFWSATQRWAGTITIPWADVLKRETERGGTAARGPEVSTPYMK